MHASSVPSGSYFPHQEMRTAPISMPQMKRSLSWQNSANLSPTISSAVSITVFEIKIRIYWSESNS
jgi:hypothetical protein